MSGVGHRSGQLLRPPGSGGDEAAAPGTPGAPSGSPRMSGKAADVRQGLLEENSLAARHFLLEVG